MRRAILLFTPIALAWAQPSTGTIAGAVRDGSAAAVPMARVELVSLTTGANRRYSTSAQGDYSLPALLAGEYELSVEAPGFSKQVRRTTVEAGSTTTADFTLAVGDTSDSITVEGASPQMQYDSHAVSGVVTQTQLDSLPLNGRSFLELAKLEPGVLAPVRAGSNRTFVPVLGAPGGMSGRGTRVTVDGGSIMAVGNGGSAMGLSQESVQEFQTSTVNFDLSTGATFSGALNVVTRSGGNEIHGAVFGFFRDHTLAAYPLLARDPSNPDPFFQRRQFGGALGGPLRRNRVFFFAGWERNEQRGVLEHTFAGDFSSWSGVTPSPLFGNLANLRLDARLSAKHTAFLRYSHDGSRAFAPTGDSLSNAYPSAWSRQLGWADQSLLGLTSVLRPTLLNDFRFSYFFQSFSQLPPEQQDCAGCLGIGAPDITVGDLIIGNSTTSLTLARRYQLTDSVNWQTGRHRVRFGLDGEYNRGGADTVSAEPVSIKLFSPQNVRTFNASPKTAPDQRLALPASFGTLDDILSLPLQSFNIGIGDQRVPQENGGNVRRWNTLRLYFQDTWKLHPRLTVNYGLAWSIDRDLNYDLRKPALLAPLLGPQGLGPTRKKWKNFSPTAGLAWTPSRDAKTVIRAGAGIYYDFLFNSNLDDERVLLSPPGLGYKSIPGSSIFNPLPGASGVLEFKGSPTAFTGANLMSILAEIRDEQTRIFRSGGDPSVQTIQISKSTGTAALYPSDVPTWSSLHTNVGVERRIARDFVVTADFAYRHFIHGGFGSALDLNHYNSARGPVIPQCSQAQAIDPLALCSKGVIKVTMSGSTQTYAGLLVRAEKRFSQRFQVLASYAYSSNTGTTTGAGFNLDNWLGSRGPLPTDFTHILNVSGVVQLPWRFEMGLNFSYISAPPLSVTIGSSSNGIDFNGDGTTGDLLPGSGANAFNRGMGPSDLVRLVDQFNETYAGTAVHGRAISKVVLPSRYSLGDDFHALDVRLSRTFVVHEQVRCALIGEVFNLYNNANLSGYGGDLTSAAFGQPTRRATQVFGSGGPRALQAAIKVSF